MKFGSLFAGIGGFDLGFERAGMSSVWQVEFDEKASSVLEKHWPDTKRYGDVRDVGKRNLEPVDLICGGFPCQDVSVAGKREGLAGERSGLWFEYHRIIAELKPSWIVIENVPGLLSSNGGEDFAVILRGLVELGYGVAWRILDSQYLRVAQRRRRVFIVGSLGNGRAAEVLFESESGGWHPSEGRKQREDSAGESVSSPENDSGVKAYNISSYNSNSMLSDNPHSGIQEIKTIRTLDASGVSPNKNQGGAMIVFDGRNLETSEVSHTLQSKKNGGYSLNYTPMVFQQNVRDEVRLVGGDGKKTGALQAQPGMKQQNFIWEQRSKDKGAPRIHDKNVSPTMSKHWGTGGHNVPMIGVRRLTPTECARLQGFPDNWNDWLADSHRYKQFGNAVTVNVAEWIGKRIMKVHERSL